MKINKANNTSFESIDWNKVDDSVDEMLNAPLSDNESDNSSLTVKTSIISRTNSNWTIKSSVISDTSEEEE